MARRALVLTFSLLVLLSLFAAPSALADPGDLDPNWSADGRQLTSFGSLDDGANAIAVQTDEKVVAVGSTNTFFAPDPNLATKNGVGPQGTVDNDWALVRYRSDGVLDTTFGPSGNGRVRLDSGASLEIDLLEDVVVDGDDKLVVGGEWDSSPAVARFLSNGTLDATFNPGGPTPGIRTLPFDGVVRAVMIDTSGRLVVSGANFFQDRLIVARFEPDGDLDPTFSAPDGIFTLELDDDVTFGNDLALQPDGKIVAVGGWIDLESPDEAWIVIRLTTAGALDGTFNPGGSPPGTRLLFVEDEGSSSATAVAMQGNKSIVVGNVVSSGCCPPVESVLAPVTRLNANGSTDPTFANGGVKFVTSSNADPGLFDVMVQPDRKIVVVGSDQVFEFELPEEVDMLAARLTRDSGAYDSTFHGDGRVTVDFGAFEMAAGGALQLDGNVLLAGLYLPGLTPEGGEDPDSDIAVARALGDYKGLDCTVNGTPGNDVLSGTAHADVICGGAGNDTLKGFKGNDILRGGQGNDTLEGGLGADYLGGYAGNDTLNAADGAPGDVVEGASGADTCSTDPSDVIIDC